VNLFMVACGGRDGTELLEPLKDAHWSYGLLFPLYIFFIYCGVLNVVTSIFVDSALLLSQKDRDIAIQSQLNQNISYAKRIKEFFHEADKDNSGMLSWDEFETYLADDKVKAYFSTLDLDVSQATLGEAHALFLLLDTGEDGEVGIDEFVEGCKRLKGSAKSIDVNMLLYENEKLIARLSEFMKFTEESIGSLLIQKRLSTRSENSFQSSSEESSPVAPTVGKERRASLTMVEKGMATLQAALLLGSRGEPPP
ncbi:unnamed protein product, partial [Polarella glacialis]